MKVHIAPSEARVLDLARRGLTDTAIAERLTCSRKTVEAHFQHVREKLGLDTRPHPDFNLRTLVILWWEKSGRRGEPQPDGAIEAPGLFEQTTGVK